MADEETSQAAREGEAERAREEAEAESEAAAKRGRERQRASARKSIPEGAQAAEATRGGETAYPYQRLIDDAQDFFDVAPHVVAGALYGVDREYLTRDEVGALIEEWQAKEINPAPADEG